MEGLAELPIVGALLEGGAGAVGLRVGALVALVAVVAAAAWWLLKKGPLASLLSGQGAHKSLARRGLFVEAGNAAMDAGAAGAALTYYEKARSWTKAGNAARQLGDLGKAGALYEKARDFRLAFNAFEAAGKSDDSARVAIEIRDPVLVSQVAQRWVDKGESGAAARFFREAGMIDDAERMYLKDPEDGALGAAEMYVELYQKAMGTGLGDSEAEEMARKAASLFNKARRPEKAHKILVEAGLRGTTGAISLTLPTDARKPVPVGVLKLKSSPALPRGPTAAEVEAGQSPQETDLPDPSGGATLSKKTGGDNCLDALVAPHEGEKSDACDGYKEGSNPTIDSFVAEVTERYEVLEELGRGGMGRVYKAMDRNLGRLTALKFLKPELMNDERAVDLFQQEARSSAALSHPAIVVIYDVGSLGGRLYIAMELVEGASLARILNASGPMIPVQAFDVATRLTEAVQYAHDKGVIHRDIKPRNVMVSRDWSPKLLDFGLARATQETGHVGAAGGGTPRFMAPEQLAHEAVDVRTDVFGLGVLLYCALTAQLPYKDSDRTIEVAPPSTVVNWVPAAVDGVVAKAMALDPGDRYQSAEELADALRRVRSRALGRTSGVIEVVNK